MDLGPNVGPENGPQKMHIFYRNWQNCVTYNMTQRYHQYTVPHEQQKRHMSEAG